jgi:hypothetical protein
MRGEHSSRVRPGAPDLTRDLKREEALMVMSVATLVALAEVTGDRYDVRKTKSGGAPHNPAALCSHLSM